MRIAYETDTADMDRSPDRNSMGLHTVVPKAGEFLIRRGVPFHSVILQKLSRKIDHHGLIAFRLQDQYDAMFTLS